MRRSLPLVLAIAALCGCATAAATNSKQAPKKSYWASLDDGVIDPRAAFGNVSVIWVHPPQTQDGEATKIVSTDR